MTITGKDVRAVLMVATIAAIAYIRFVVPLMSDLNEVASSPVGRVISFRATPTLGSDNPSVGIVEYSDLSCEDCRTFTKNVLPELERAHLNGSHTVIAFRHMPSANASLSRAAECAHRQGHFWEMRRTIVDIHDTRDVTYVKEAQELGLDISQFAICLSGSAVSKIEDDYAQARALGITQRPTFLIGRVEAKWQLKIVAVVDGRATIADFGKVLADAIRGTAANTSNLLKPPRR